MRSPLTKVSGSSRPGIPAERDRQTILDLHVAIKRGTLFSGETKKTRFTKKDAHRVPEGILSNNLLGLVNS
jgi:hypothetical protein